LPYRGSNGWPHFIALFVIGSNMFGLSLARFCKALATMAW